MGSGGADIMASPAARRALPISIEAKKTAADPGRKAMKQAQYNAAKGTIGAVVWQTTGEGGTKGEIRFDLEEFIDWFKTIYQVQRRINETCGRCFGRGQISVAQEDTSGYGSTVMVPDTCPRCKGSGKIKDSDNEQR
jgi:hypothetical protein